MSGLRCGVPNLPLTRAHLRWAPVPRKGRGNEGHDQDFKDGTLAAGAQAAPAASCVELSWGVAAPASRRRALQRVLSLAVPSSPGCFPGFSAKCHRDGPACPSGLSAKWPAGRRVRRRSGPAAERRCVQWSASRRLSATARAYWVVVRPRPSFRCCPSGIGAARTNVCGGLVAAGGSVGGDRVAADG